MKALLLAVALGMVAIPAAAQSADARWEPFLGCWQMTADNVRNAAPAAAPLAGAALPSRARNASGPRVCVTRTEDGGARFETTVSGQAAIVQTLVADATDRPLDDKECRGTQSAEFSSDGQRIFSRAQLTCEGDAGPRRVSGISLLASNGDWVDIQAVDIASRETVRVRRYYRDYGAASEVADRRAALRAANLSLDDVKEASTKVVPRALEAALVETTAGFYLSGKDLLALDDAGVPDTVIDVIVALSYPERFVIERTARGGGGGGSAFGNDPFMVGWAFGYPTWYDDYYYSPYYYSPFAYNRYGYGGYGGYGGFGGYVDGIGGGIAVIPVEPQPSGTARAVDGQGYTRIRPRETVAAGDSQSPTTRTSNAPASDSGSSSSSSGSSSGTASSGGGYTGGASSGDTGRTAQPR